MHSIKKLIGLLLVLGLFFITSGCYHAPHSLAPVQPPARIALLLPLHGTMHQHAEAIKNGFLDAFYQNSHHTEILIYDTTTASIETIYHKAIQEGADAIVGPLLKTDLETLLQKQTLAIPTLALNTTNQNSDHLYQLSLSPHTEIVQIAQHMKQKQRHRTLLIIFGEPLGLRLQTDFKHTWRALHGEIVDSLVYQPNLSLAEPLRDFLKLPEKEKRGQIPHPRQDFDSIFMVAPPRIARQIVPLLRFYGVEHTPIYSTSAIYVALYEGANKNNNENNNEDINGVIFVDIPWPAIPYPNPYPRFYALGIDAYRVITHLHDMENRDPLQGATGTLILQPDGTIDRTLTALQVDHGSLSTNPEN